MDKKKIIAIVVLLIAAVAGWYFMYFTKTPVYSLNEARVAVEKHDVATFKKHVDLDSIFGSAYDDLIAVELEKPEVKENPFAGFAQVILKGMKSQIVGAMSNACYDKIGEAPQANSAAQDTQSAKADESMALVKGQQLEESMNVSDLKFKSVQEADINGDVALVPVVFESDNPDRGEVIFTVEMHRLDDKTWQAVRISDFKEYLELQEALKADKAKGQVQAQQQTQENL